MTQEQQLKSLILEKQGLELRLDILNTKLQDCRKELSGFMHEFQPQKECVTVSDIINFHYKKEAKTLVLFKDGNGDVEELKYFNSKKEIDHYANVNRYPCYIIAENE